MYIINYKCFSIQTIIYPVLTEAFDYILYSSPLYLENAAFVKFENHTFPRLFKVQREGVKNTLKSLSEKWIDNTALTHICY